MIPSGAGFELKDYRMPMEQIKKRRSDIQI